MNIKDLYEKTVEKIGIEDKEPVPFYVSTGSLLLDRVIGGGYPAGRIIEIYGPEGSGKTTLGIHGMAEAQKLGHTVGIIDMETALDLEYARTIGIQGVRNQDWLHVSPESGEQAIDTISFWAKSDVKFILVDSVAAMTPRAEFDGETGEGFMGLQARMMGQAMRKLTNVIYKHDVILVFINQVRQKIGVVYGNPEVTTGGKALGFYSSMRLETRASGDAIKDGTIQIGRYTRIQAKKNKLAPPFRTVQVPIVWGKGIWKSSEMVDVLLSEGIITKKGSWFYFKDEQLALGRDKAALEVEKDYDKYAKALKEKWNGS